MGACQANGYSSPITGHSLQSQPVQVGTCKQDIGLAMVFVQALVETIPCFIMDGIANANTTTQTLSGMVHI